MIDKKEQPVVESIPPESELVRKIFDDNEAKTSVVGLFNLLFTIDKRTAPENYAHIAKP